jgi:hypothetical protein
MKVLIIDSHKGNQSIPQNLHWLNADKLRHHLLSLGHDVQLIWSYPSVNDNIINGYDCIIFNHASRYSYISDEWLRQNQSAKLFYITNEYNLGEPLILWSWAKTHNQKFSVIANHQMGASKVVKKYVNDWHIVNLNALIIEQAPYIDNNQFFNYEKRGCVYYGSFRKDRVVYFQKYLVGNIAVSTHIKNRYKFEDIGVHGPFCDRINWVSRGLSEYKTSLYIEDESTHENYNFLANRFYEALNYNVFPLFDTACKNTLELSAYDIPAYAMVDSSHDVMYVTSNLPDDSTQHLSSWRNQALEEKSSVLHTITQLITS